MTIEKLQTHKVNVTVKVDRDEKVRIDTIANNSKKSILVKQVVN